jgi:hypothetical protein
MGHLGQAASRKLKPADLADLYAQYPSLKSSAHRITSKDNDEYNCVAWIPKEFDRWYEPGIYWPPGIPEPPELLEIECYVALFESWGFERCGGASFETGFLKIAVYGRGDRFCHVAKQIRGGGWSSKGGVLHDFRHDSLDALHPCGIMENARPVLFMRRQDDGRDPQHLERTGIIPA